MDKTRRHKRDRRVCKGIASFLAAILLINQVGFSALAKETGGAVCSCDICCAADSVNESCQICAGDYGKCEGAVTDTAAEEETEDSGAGEGTETGVGEEMESSGTGEGMETETETGEGTESSGTGEGAETETGVGEGTESSGTGEGAETETGTGEETESSGTGEGAETETGVGEGTESSDPDTAPEAGLDTDDEAIVLPQGEKAEKGIEENAVSPASVGERFSDGLLEYTVIKDDGNDRQVEVAENQDETSVSGDLEIPAKASKGSIEYAVVRIGDNAFFNCYNLTNATIPDSVTGIGEYAFYHCDHLESITIPDSVIRIEKQAFEGCSGLKSITIPQGITSIEEAVFSYCSSLQSIIIPQGVTSIGTGAFSGCSNAESITIPDSVTSIGQGAFSACSNLKSIEIPEGVTSIALFTFFKCSSLESITIPSKVASIGQYAFEECSSLTGITIPASVTVIESYGFSKCSKLATVTIMNDSVVILSDAFDSCGCLNSLQIALSENITATPNAEDSCFSGCPADRYLTFLTKDGKTELSDTTKPTLAEAKGVYDAVNDGGINDGYWYGWKLSKDPVVTNHPVTIKVNKDGGEWKDCPKKFALSPDYGSTFFADLTDVPNGSYIVYETESADGTGYVSTGVPVEVKDGAAEAEINYYTVTFYNEDIVFEEQIVRDQAKAEEPSAAPIKDGYTFYRWVTDKDGSAEFDFGQAITAKTDLYASWSKDEVLYTITASAGTGGSVSPSGKVKVKDGADQQFTITPQEGRRIASVLVDGSEVLASGGRKSVHAKAGISDAENSGKYYVFENVTANHTLEAYFEAFRPVTIKVNKDGGEWKDCPKKFALSSDHGSTFLTDLTDVSKGTYIVYETESADGTGYVSTGVSVEVKDGAAEAEVNYYTVTFYNEDAVFEEQIVPDKAKAEAPSAAPTKDGYTFYRWVTDKDGSAEFDFGQAITAKTDLYASWSKDEVLYTITASAGAGGIVSPSGKVKVKAGADQRFTITPQEGCRITSVLVDGSEALTGRGRRAANAKAGISDAENGAKYYVFEKVTGDHTLTAHFEAFRSVTIKVNKDGSEWKDCPKKFALSSDHGSTFLTDLTNVSKGTYIVYETESVDGTGYESTGVSVEVKDGAAEAEIDYYTVTFYSEDAVFEEQIVLNRAKAVAPSSAPTKDGYTFYRWVTSKEGSTEFDFDNGITAKTDLYASWSKDEVLYTITASAGAGGSVSPSGKVKVKAGADQRFTITPREGCRITSILVDGSEALTGRGRRAANAKAGISDAENSGKYYVFENVTDDHTLEAYFETIEPGDNAPDDPGNSDPDDGGGSGGTGGGGAKDNRGADNSGGGDTDTGFVRSIIFSAGPVSAASHTRASDEREPKTGDSSHIEVYATIAMVAGLSYILLYFADGKLGMTEEEKKEIVASLVKWAKKGRKVRKYAALAVIFLILVYYHSIGKRTVPDWKAVYEK